jgi:Zn-finger nucleic acid-binding protein
MDHEVQVEIKYCERCGGLWLRRVGSQEAYCFACVPIMREIARPRPKADTTPRWIRERLALRGATCA